ncbi:hypothetical protein [Caulobacter sp. LARHSG274]
MRNGAIGLAIAISITAFGLPSIAKSQKAPVLSWGKPEVSFDDYRRDSIECGKRGATTSMKGRSEFDAVMLGLNRQDADIDIGRSLPPSATLEDPAQKLARDYALNSAKSRPEPKVKALQNFLEQNVETCLAQKGYVRFTLTPAQAADLDRHKKGSEGRFRFLHALASDEAVIRQQRYQP